MADEVETKIEYLGQPGVIGEVTYDALKKRVAELEAALNDIIDKTGRAHPMSYVADIWRIARAALEGEKDE